MKTVFKILGWLVLGAAALLGVFLLYTTLADYSPQQETLVSESAQPTRFPIGQEVNVMSWNLGYCGLSSEMDFFYDGGKSVRPTEETVRRNISAMLEILARHKAFDFFLLQEVDLDSKRSYHSDQMDSIGRILPEHKAFFGKNYEVAFVPTPPIDPMGKVLSGIVTYSKAVPSLSTRYQYPGQYAWPKGLFLLDRCFVLNRYPTSDGKELLVINTHNSAYDDGGQRRAQMEMLKTLLLAEHQAGNYVIAGGDWNQCPPGFDGGYPSNIFDKDDLIHLESDYPAPGWRWFYDDSKPSNRRVDIPYDPSQTRTTTIDFFLLSPNVEGISVEVLDLEFAYSDHQPVLMKARLGQVEPETSDSIATSPSNE